MFRVLAAAVSLLALDAAAAQSLTEGEAVERGLAQPDVRAMLAARRDIATGEAAAAGRWDNPSIEYSSETVDLPGGESEETSLWIRQRLNIAGVHGLERDAAEQARIAEGARVDFARREAARDIRRLFYDALAAVDAQRTIAAWQARLEELTVAVEKRMEAGDASRYDHLRLARELALLRGEAMGLQANAESARDRLFSLIGGPRTALAGTLLPPAGGGSAAMDIIAGHPLLVALGADAGSATLAAKAAARAAWPEVTVGVGRRELEQPDFGADGNLVMLGIEIPLFDRGDGRQFAAESRARRLQAERVLAANRLAADARAAQRAVDAQRRAALMLVSSNEGDASLSAIAESAYAAGEITVMELIDAHRADLAAEQQALARARAAREAWIDLQLLRGDL